MCGLCVMVRACAVSVVCVCWCMRMCVMVCMRDVGVCGVCVLGTIGYVIRGSVAMYYAKYYLGGDADIQANFMATGVSAAILAMVASTWITKQ